MSNSLRDKFQAHYEVLIIKMSIKSYGVIVSMQWPVRAYIDVQGAERQHWYRLESLQTKLTEAAINMINDNCW